MPNPQEVLAIASIQLERLSGHVFDLLTVSKPVSPGAAVNLSKVVSKLSPLLGNLIEFNTVEFLNDLPEFKGIGEWVRQDPGFPDTIFLSNSVKPAPGFEIKAWFPLSTEITARFKDSQNHFKDDQTNVCLIAWLPDQLIFGKPRILDVCVVTGRSMAESRDSHYHNPPDYLVVEPGDTTARTRNLQQTNTNGHKWQGTPEQFRKAQRLVASWGPQGRVYQPTPEYQTLLRQLINRFPYRLDTNYAKIDRIVHPGIEEFKRKVYSSTIHGLTVEQWIDTLSSGDDDALKKALAERFDIRDTSAEQILE
jgi:hypothetical protein